MPSPCPHASATPTGCPLCEIAERLKSARVVATDLGPAMACPYCNVVVLIVERGDTTVFHAKPECDTYLATTIGRYYSTLRAIAEAGDAGGS